MKQIMCMAFIAVMLFSCHNNADAPQLKKAEPEKIAPKKEQQTLLTDSSQTKTAANSNNTATPQKAYEDPSKKLIKTANLTVELKDYNKYNNYLHNSLKPYGAYIASEEQSQTDSRIENSISIKVPVGMFDDLLNALNMDSTKVLTKNISTTDVGAEIYDNKARALSKKMVRDRYLSLLKEAHKTEEVLAIENEINNAQSEAESSSNRAAFLSTQAAYSTINIKYFQTLVITDEPAKDVPFLTQLSRAFGNGAGIIGRLLVCFITIWPLVLIAAIAWYILKKYRLHKSSAPKQTSA